MKSSLKDGKKLESISKNVGAQKKRILLSDLLLNVILFPRNKGLKLLSKRGLAALSGSSSHMPMEERVYLADSSYSTNQHCNGFSICAVVCPVANIEITDKRPVWLNHCENCLACYDWCPQKAIQSEIAQKGYYYHHPDVKISDMIWQKK